MNNDISVVSQCQITMFTDSNRKGSLHCAGIPYSPRINKQLVYEWKVESHDIERVFDTFRDLAHKYDIIEVQTLALCDISCVALEEGGEYCTFFLKY